MWIRFLIGAVVLHPVCMAAPTQALASSLSSLPLRFESQADPKHPFVARNGPSSVWLGPQGAVLRARGAQPIRIDLEHANRAAAAEPLDELAMRSNYFIGSDPAAWRRDVRNYGKVLFREVWPGIDLVWYGNGGELEFDLVVSPGADARAIELRVTSSDRIRLDDTGDLLLGGGVRQHKPRIYQDTAAGQRSIAGRYVLAAGNRVRFQLAKYDRSLPLVIDPVLAYSTLFGGVLDEAVYGIAVDAVGNAYITGYTDSPDLPATTDGTKFMGSAAPDLYVAKVKADGSGVVYCSYIGGRDDDEAEAIAIDAAGNAYITGYTFSTDFPTTAGVVQKAYGGGNGDAFVLKLGPAGNTLVYSTFLGGVAEDEGRSIAVDATGNAYVAGITNSSLFPTAGSPYQARYRGGAFDGFVAKLNPAGTALVYSTFLGSSGDDEPMGLAIDSTGSAYITGSTDGADFPTTKGAVLPNPPNPNGMAFVTKLNPGGTSLVYSTFLGGNVVDSSAAIAVDSAGSAYVVGSTGSNAFPRTTGAPQQGFGGGLLDAFISKLKPDGSGLVYSTFLGGNDVDAAMAVAVDAGGNAYVAGTTYSADFPSAGSPFQATAGGGADAFVACVNPAGTALVYSTYLGGSQNDRGFALALGSPGNAYVGGQTISNNFRTTPNAMRKSQSLIDGFVARVQEVALPSLVSDKTTLTFNYDVTGAAPGPQTIQLTSSGAALSFTATTTGAAWLAVGPGSGSTPVTVSAFVNPAGLVPNTYNGNIVITSTGAANSPLTIPVKLVVTQAAPAPTLSGIVPNTVAAGGQDLTITVNGSNFLTASAVNANSTPVATTFVNATTLSALIPAKMLANPGTVAITVTNPAPNSAVTAAINLAVTAPLPTVAAADVINSASMASGAIAPGEVITINGLDLGPTTALVADGSSGSYATTLGSVRVLFDGQAAPILSAGAAQIVTVVPFGLDGQQTTQFQVEYNGQRSEAIALAVAPAAPALYSLDGTGVGQGKVTNADGSANGKDSPAPAGTLVTIAATGGGQTSPASVDGAVVSDTTPQLNLPVAVQMGGEDCADVTVGPAPGLISGMLVVTARVPADLSGTVPVVFTVGGAPSQSGVTLEVAAAQ
jgi:uncharacterized protein (TIGR03437 family)